jgi:hypothetical protein
MHFFEPLQPENWAKQLLQSLRLEHTAVPNCLHHEMAVDSIQAIWNHPNNKRAFTEQGQNNRTRGSLLFRVTALF